MKRKYIKISFLVLTSLIAFIIMPFIQGCHEEKEEAVPQIGYVRLTDPEKADSLIVSAFLGNTIALIGKNLQNVKQVWFNDQEAYLNTSFITDFSIIVTIPDAIPEVVTNEITLITYGGIESKYPFYVGVPGPKLDGMTCEYVPDGDVAVIKGNFFLEDEANPLEVYFPGNLKAEVLDVSLKEVTVRVPDGSGVGPLTVKSLYGSSRSSFYFRDDRNIILDYDTKLGAGWRPGKTQSTNPDGISGNYVALRGSLANDWDWVEDDLAAELWGQAAGLPEGPLFEGDPKGMAMKFEAYVVNDWSGGYMQLILSPWSTADNSVNSNPDLARGFWRPWESEANGVYKTDGWITVTVPLADFKYDPNGTRSDLELVYPDNSGSLTIFVWGPVPAACDLFICVDNVRIVPM